MAEANRYQRAALSVYAAGDFADINNPTEVEGDTLLKFVLIELSDGEDCEDLATAKQRITTALSDLEDVLRALCELAD